MVAWRRLVAWSEFVWRRCVGTLPPMCSASESFFHGAWSSAALPDSAERCFILLMAAYLGVVAQWRFGVRCVAMDSRRRTKLSGVVVTSIAEWPDKVEASI